MKHHFAVRIDPGLIEQVALKLGLANKANTALVEGAFKALLAAGTQAPILTKYEPQFKELRTIPELTGYSDEDLIEMGFDAIKAIIDYQRSIQTVNVNKQHP